MHCNFWCEKNASSNAKVKAKTHKAKTCGLKANDKFTRTLACSPSLPFDGLHPYNPWITTHFPTPEMLSRPSCLTTDGLPTK